MKYRVTAIKHAGLKTIDQTFSTFDAAARARDYLRGKGYTAAVSVAPAPALALYVSPSA